MVNSIRMTGAFTAMHHLKKFEGSSATSSLPNSVLITVKFSVDVVASSISHVLRSLSTSLPNRCVSYTS